MLNALRKMTNGLLNPASRRRKQRRVSEAPAEVLEDRSLLAGNVIASMNARGDLKLTGDNSDNQVSVQQLDNGAVIVQGFQGTQINGSTDTAMFGTASLRHLKVNMKRGNDGVVVGTSVLGNVTVNMGPGSDGFQMGGGDEDDFEVVVGNIKVNLGSAGSTQEVAFLEYMAVLGNVTIKGSNGSQQAVVGNLLIDKQLNVNLGKGDDQLQIQGVEASSHKLNGGKGFDVFTGSPGTWENRTGFELIIKG